MTSLRNWVRRIHLWLGLGIGLLFAILGVSGSLLIFYVEIDAAINPAIRMEASAPPPGWDSPAWDRALATAREAWPEEAGRWSFEATGLQGSIAARHYPSMGGHHDGFRLVWFSPDGARVLRVEQWGGTLMTWLYDLHRNYLAGEFGNAAVGWTGVAMLILLITGLFAWWPRGQWRKALAYKRKAAPTRRLRDLHKLTGLWSLVLLAVLAATGVLLALPDERSLLLGTIAAPVIPVPSPASTPSGDPPISVARASASAQAALPEGRLTWIDVPEPGEGAFRFRVRVPGDPIVRFPQSYVFVDQYSGEVLAVHDAREGNASTVINQWLRPLHDASVGGLTTRILGVVIGFAPAILFITGLLRWRRIRAARQRRQAVAGVSPLAGPAGRRGSR